MAIPRPQRGCAAFAHTAFLRVGSASGINVGAMYYPQLAEVSPALWEGIASLSALQHLHMDFTHTVFHDIAGLGAAIAALHELRHLRLDFKSAANVSDIASLGAIAGLLQLEDLDLNFDQTKVSDISDLGHAVGKLSQLKCFRLNCEQCWDLRARGPAHGRRSPPRPHLTRPRASPRR